MYWLQNSYKRSLSRVTLVCPRDRGCHWLRCCLNNFCVGCDNHCSNSGLRGGGGGPVFLCVFVRKEILHEVKNWGHCTKKKSWFVSLWWSDEVLPSRDACSELDWNETSSAHFRRISWQSLLLLTKFIDTCSLNDKWRCLSLRCIRLCCCDLQRLLQVLRPVFTVHVLSEKKLRPLKLAPIGYVRVTWTRKSLNLPAEYHVCLKLSSFTAQGCFNFKLVQ